MRKAKYGGDWREVLIQSGRENKKPEGFSFPASIVLYRVLTGRIIKAMLTITLPSKNVYKADSGLENPQE